MEPAPQRFVETHTGLVYLSLWGDFEPEVAIREIGLVPFKTREPKESPSGWRANVSFSKGERKGDSLDVYAMVDELLEEIAPKAKSIRDFVAAVNGEICLSVVLEISTQLDGGSTRRLV